MFGIDNTLIDISGLAGLPYSEVMTGSLEAPPIESVVNVATTAKEKDIAVLILTTRPERYREETVELLKKFDIHPDLIWMRIEADKDSEVEYKSKSLESLRSNYTILNVFEDNEDVVGMLVREGYSYVHVV